jgi:NAD(P)-dependent dehydrogenase (short-subunit alcohol dehydrogenase family)
MLRQPRSKPRPEVGKGHGRTETQAALYSLSRSFAASFGWRRITVPSIAPGWLRTDRGGQRAPLFVAARF